MYVFMSSRLAGSLRRAWRRAPAASRSRPPGAPITPPLEGDRLGRLVLAAEPGPGSRCAPLNASQGLCLSFFLILTPGRSRSPANADCTSAQVTYAPGRWWMTLRSPRKRAKARIADNDEVVLWPTLVNDLA